jgi:hypothetical protein
VAVAIVSRAGVCPEQTTSPLLVEIAEAQRDDVASAQPQPRKHKGDRPMSQAARRARVARRDDPLDLDVTRQRRGAPLRNDRHCMLESTPTLAEPEVASNRGGHVPHVDERGPLRLSNDDLADVLSTPTARARTERRKQTHEQVAIQSDSPRAAHAC